MVETLYSEEIAEKTAQAALVSASGGIIKGFVLKEARSPWEEKIRLHRSWDYIEAELHVWKSPQFLAARINRLALFVLDSLDPAFAFDMDAMVALKADSKIRRAHNHIWTIHVDRRIEKMVLNNFFDKSLRRNLFLDSQRGHSWIVSNRLFEKLWRKKSFTHPEIIDHAKRLGEMLVTDVEDIDSNPFEVEMSRYRSNSSAGDCVEAILPSELKDAAKVLVNFATGTCRGTLIETCCYGIRFIHEGIVFAEMVTTKKDALLLTLFDFSSENRTSYVLEKGRGDIEKIQGALKEIYEAISFHFQNNRSEEPARVPM